MLDRSLVFDAFGLNERHYRWFFQIRPRNLVIAPAWAEAGGKNAHRSVRIVGAGSRTFSDEAFLFARMDRLCERLDPDNILGLSRAAWIKKTIESISHRYCHLLQRADGYGYAFQPKPITEAARWAA